MIRSMSPERYVRLRRASTRDRSVPMDGPAKTRRIDLGLAALQRIALPGVCYSRQEIAAFAGATETAIYKIEARALGKLRAALDAGDARLRDLMMEFFEKRMPAGRARADGRSQMENGQWQKGGCC